MHKLHEHAALPHRRGQLALLALAVSCCSCDSLRDRKAHIAASSAALCRRRSLLSSNSADSATCAAVS
jgi:hypothetical protein